MSWLIRRRGVRPQAPAGSDPAERQVKAGANISGIASTGDRSVNVQYRAGRMTVLPAEALAPAAGLAAPERVSNLPSRPGLFVGRAGELAQMDAVLAEPGGLVVRAVHGL